MSDLILPFDNTQMKKLGRKSPLVPNSSVVSIHIICLLYVFRETLFSHHFSLISHYPPIINISLYLFKTSVFDQSHKYTTLQKPSNRFFAKYIELGPVIRLAFDRNCCCHYIYVLMFIILQLTDEQEGYGQFLQDQGKADALASRSAWTNKPNINRPNVLLYEPLSTKVYKWSFYAIKYIVLGCDRLCQEPGV